MLSLLPSIQTEALERFQHLMQLPVATVAQLLTEETEKFLKHQPSDDLPGMVLFTRAITQHDEEAWSCLYHHYTPLVLSWIMQQHGTAPLVAEDGGLSLINAAFARFSQALKPENEKISSFTSLSGLLSYLKCCTYSVVVDERRTRQCRQQEVSLEMLEWEPVMADPTDEVVATLSAPSLWSLIAKWTNETERLLLVLTYAYGMTPTEICRHYRQRFPTVQEVYRRKHNILGRLRRNQQVRALYKCL
jgi:hypothetical protein